MTDGDRDLLPAPRQRVCIKDACEYLGVSRAVLYEYRTVGAHRWMDGVRTHRRLPQHYRGAGMRRGRPFIYFHELDKWDTFLDLEPVGPPPKSSSPNSTQPQPQETTT